MRSSESQNKADSRRRWTVVEAEEILEAYRKSGKTQRVFAGEMGIGVSSLQYWLRRSRKRLEEGRPLGEAGQQESPLGAEATPLSLLEVKLDRGRGVRGDRSGFEIEWPGGTQLRFGAGFCAGEVRRLLALMREEVI